MIITVLLTFRLKCGDFTLKMNDSFEIIAYFCVFFSQKKSFVSLITLAEEK